MEDEDFSEPHKLDEFGCIDLEYNKRRTIHFFGQEWWDKAMAALASCRCCHGADCPARNPEPCYYCIC